MKNPKAQLLQAKYVLNEDDTELFDIMRMRWISLCIVSLAI